VTTNPKKSTARYTTRRWALLPLAAGFLSLGFALGAWSAAHGISEGTLETFSWTLAGCGLLLSFGSVLLLAGATRRPAVREVAVRAALDEASVVAIGGGTGLAALLRGMKALGRHTTAVVSVADDGGSSGRLREEMGALPPGDIRNCLVALADAEPLMKRLFDYRFPSGSLGGHSFGNLFITAMADVTGDFEQAVRQSSQVLAVRGQVLPCTVQDVTLEADRIDGTVARGETEISRESGDSPILGLRLVPKEGGPVRALPAALQAVREADLVVIGPGSLYTSILPNFLVPELAEAVREAPGLRVFVCNLMTQPGETDGFDCLDHVRAFESIAGTGLIDIVLVNTGSTSAWRLEAYREQGAEPVRADLVRIREAGYAVCGAALVDPGRQVRHDPMRLAGLLIELAARHGRRRRRGE